MDVQQSKTDYNSTCGHTFIWVAYSNQKELKASAFLVKTECTRRKGKIRIC